MKKLVSVIIPVFNTDPELVEKCLQSIKMQDYENIEIVIVDDGSLSQLAERYDALKENGIRVIHQKNMGVSVARNKGVEIAKGEFITFVDADDYLAPFAIKRGVNLIEKENADMVVGAVEKISDKDNEIIGASYKNLYVTLKNEYNELKDVCLNDIPDKYLKINGKGEIMRGPFARVIRTNIVKSTPFPEGIVLGEDVIWNLRLLKKCRCVCIDFNIWYYYVMVFNSAIHKYYGNRKDLVTDYLKILLTENPEIQEFHKDALIKNMAVEFYCILNYDLMSPQCAISYREKVKITKNILRHPIWKILSESFLFAPIPIIYKIFILLSKCGIWPLPLGMYNNLKKWNELLRKKLRGCS